MSAPEYVTAVRRYRDEVGGLDWAAPQDWMCEPWIIAKSGLSVAVHQANTVENYLTLRSLAPELPFIPVLQGWQMADYLRCIERYQDAGVDLTSVDRVGLGSVCRRQNTGEIDTIVRILQGEGLRLHGFGIKVTGLRQYGHQMASADSMAWSYRARRSFPLPGCTHKKCNNCIRFALSWRERILRILDHEQLSMEGV